MPTTRPLLASKIPFPIARIENRILLVRGHKVLLDADLAALYGVSTKRFNEQVRRNAERFPADFMLRLTRKEWDSLRSQLATLETGRGRLAGTGVGVGRLGGVGAQLGESGSVREAKPSLG